MKQWKASLRETLAESTTAGTITKAKAMLNWAVESGMIEKSPLEGVGRGSFVNEEKFRYITAEEYCRLLDAAPCQDWKTIISLARVGGLRAPSEILRLRWSDVNWDRNRFWITSPKTQRHKGKEGRWVPLFPELRIELDRLFGSEASVGKEYVINRYRSASQNLGTQFARIAKLAGIGPIEKPFNNMRSSRATDVYNEFGPFLESKWIGHSQIVALRHYLQVRDEDFNRAANGNGTKWGHSQQVTDEDFDRAAGKGPMPPRPGEVDFQGTGFSRHQKGDFPPPGKTFPPHFPPAQACKTLHGVESTQRVSIR